MLLRSQSFLGVILKERKKKGEVVFRWKIRYGIHSSFWRMDTEPLIQLVVCS